MKKIITILFTLFTFHTFSQSDYDTIKSELRINFFNQNSLHLHSYKNRVIPFDVLRPYYVSISFPYSDKINIEYFQVDSSHYLRYEYYKNSKTIYNSNFVSSGIVRVTDTILGSLHILLKKHIKIRLSEFRIQHIKR